MTSLRRNSSAVRANMRCSSVMSSGVKMSSGARSSIRKRSEEHTSELQSQSNLVCRLLLEKKKENILEGLTTDFLHLLQIHNPPLQVIQNPKLYLPFEKLKKHGNSRHYRLTVHHPSQRLAA